MTQGKTVIPKPRHALDMRFHRRVHKELSALLNGRIVDDRGNLIGRWVYSDGNVVLQFKSSTGGGSVRIEQWNPSPTTSYVTGNIVFFTPDGSSAATFYGLPDAAGNSQTIPDGVQPDTGAPYWGKFPTQGTWL